MLILSHKKFGGIRSFGCPYSSYAPVNDYTFDIPCATFPVCANVGFIHPQSWWYWPPPHQCIKRYINPFSVDDDLIAARTAVVHPVIGRPAFANSATAPAFAEELLVVLVQLCVLVSSVARHDLFSECWGTDNECYESTYEYKELHLPLLLVGVSNIYYISTINSTIEFDFCVPMFSVTLLHMGHIHEKIDFTTVAVIVHKNKVLLVYHKKLKKWLFVGGHIELDEDPEQALFREIKEECGLEVEVHGNKPEHHTKGRRYLFAPTYLDIHPITENHSHIGMVYFAKAASDTVTLAEREHDEIRWFTDIELDDPGYLIQEDIKFYAREGLRYLSKWLFVSISSSRQFCGTL
jgi:8-oxo-dGTP pyrophosphatase MutT (NUDIX family)